MKDSRMGEYGKCAICGNHAAFFVEEGCSLRETRCIYCQGSKRNRDLAQIIVQTFLNDDTLSLAEGLKSFKNLAIYETQMTGSVHNCLKHLPRYSCSEYFDMIPAGSTNESGIRCENLERLSFPHNSFDLVISQDVLEHVRNPEDAFREIYRVLKPGGSHIFTVPLHEGRKTTRRVEIQGEKDIAVLPPVYHGDPLRHAGSLVYTDFGEDITDLLNALHMHTEIAIHEKFYSVEAIPWIQDDASYSRYLDYSAKGDILKFFLYNSVVLKTQKSGSGIQHTKETDTHV
jgi:SAM-dependent methyltransferase